MSELLREGKNININRMDENKKISIIERNLDLPVHEIKKLLKQEFPEVTTEEVEKLVIKVNKLRRELEDSER